MTEWNLELAVYLYSLILLSHYTFVFAFKIAYIFALQYRKTLDFTALTCV